MLQPDVEVEIYVLAGERAQASAERFLAAFATPARPRAERYELPQFARAPRTVFDDVDALLHHLERHPGEPYSLYWDVPAEIGAGRDQAMLFFGDDGCMIAGVAVDGARAHEAFVRLAECLDARFGHVARHMPPPVTRAAFVERCRLAGSPRLVDGLLLSDRAANEAVLEHGD